MTEDLLLHQTAVTSPHAHGSHHQQKHGRQPHVDVPTGGFEWTLQSLRMEWYTLDQPPVMVSFMKLEKP